MVTQPKTVKKRKNFKAVGRYVLKREDGNLILFNATF